MNTQSPLERNERYSAVGFNWLWSLIGLLFAAVGNIVAVRALGPDRFPEYAAALSIIALINLLADAGTGSGIVRFFPVACRADAGGSFYLEMQRRRLWLCLVIMVAVSIGIPFFWRRSAFGHLADSWPFVISIGVISASQLFRNTSHFGLLSLFHHKIAVGRQTLFTALKAIVVAAIAILGGTTTSLVLGLSLVYVVEAIVAHQALWARVRIQRAPIPDDLCLQANKFGYFTILDKFSSATGNGSFLLLVFGYQRSTDELSHIALGADIAGKLLSLSVMPIGNIVNPYLSSISDAGAAQRTAVARIAMIYALLLGTSVVGAQLILPIAIPAVYGNQFVSALTVCMILLFSSMTEGWIRGFVSPALLRNNQGFALLTFDALQVALTIGAIAVSTTESIAVALLLILGLRVVCYLTLARALFSIVPFRDLLPATSVFGSALIVSIVLIWLRPLLNIHFSWQTFLCASLTCSYVLVAAFMLNRDSAMLPLLRRIKSRLLPRVQAGA